MLFRCHHDPTAAYNYVHLQRYYRVRRIGHEVRRHFQTAFPDYGEQAADSIVRSTLYHCRFCTPTDMAGYMAAVQTFQDY